jgi:bacterial/archaeal transporter family protein
MQAELWAVLTAFCWAMGSLLEKSGMRLGGLTPVMGTAIRSFFSLILLSFLSFPFWKEIRQAGLKPLLLIAVGGGLLAGGLGLLCLYSALKSGQLSIVMTIAFCLTPVIGAVLGVLVLGERLAPLQAVGIVLCIAGAAMSVLFRSPQPG